MIASALHLSRADVKALKITDAYSLHRVVYDLFDDVRSVEEKQTSVSSGILYADKGGDFNGRKILMLSNRQPNIPEHGELSIKKITDSFLDYENYRFEVVINPTKRENQSRRIIVLRKREDIAAWFINKALHWGFEVSPEHLEVREIEVKRFEKGEQIVTQGQAKLIGILTVADKIKFAQSFKQGLDVGGHSVAGFCKLCRFRCFTPRSWGMFLLKF